MSFDLAQYRATVQTNYEGWVQGSAPSYVTATEGGDKRNRWVELEVDTTLPAIAGGADLAVGKLVWNFPTHKAILVRSAHVDLVLAAQDGNIIADTPDVGLGTVIGSGAVAVLSGTGTFENILTGQTATDCNGTPIIATVGLASDLSIAATAAHTVYLNVADGWAASGETACPVSGLIVIEYRVMS